MSEVKRYDFDYYTTEHSGLECVEKDDGDYVLYTDYQSLQEENKRLKESNEQLRELCGE